jgi:hypothetical protein
MVAGVVFVVFRSNGSATAPTTTAPHSTSTPQPIISPEQSIRSFFADDQVILQKTGEATPHPGVGEQVTPWTARTDGGTYRIWLGDTPSGDSFVVRARADGTQSSPDAGTPSPGASGKPLKSEQQARDAAQAWAQRFEEFARLTLVDGARGPYKDDRGKHYAFTWQLATDDSHSGGDGMLLLPTWVSVWIDQDTGRLVAYDRLRRAAGRHREKLPVSGKDALVYPVPVPKDQATLLVAPLRSLGHWRTAVVWRLTSSDAPDASPSYVDAVSGDPLDALDLYIPDPRRLPGFEP